ncbi:hypothetical protein A2318_02440 [Candidatus Uhrbacteria bacterium RIFOXYB2_FULL_45_11]|uniref:Uncharacterized protein n=1 Tax=Candidatus Uhrbacteria bacterium RIFOXYB2_FULL_45_11 TaxID=1802421 RepID=A0A1F7W3J3_9BACT|nr:MAG: hypothetical protein A2318_02440 [Candidatus Uhrbacteria bacterium RIFOXYB2_FULL_45_11]
MTKRRYYECAYGYLGSFRLGGGEFYNIEVGTDDSAQDPYEVLESYAFTVGRFVEGAPRVEIEDKFLLEVFRALVQQKMIKLDMVCCNHAWLIPLG